MRYLSLFSGIEAASVACDGMGWEAMAFAEIDPFPSAVLAERYPQVPNLGDVTKVNWRSFVKKCGRPDLVVGGGAPASPSRSQGPGPGSKGRPDSCGSTFELFARSGLSGFFGRTSPERSRARMGRISDACSGPWMRSGMVWHGGYLTRSSSAWPSDASVSFLSDALEAAPPVEVLFEPESVPWDPTPSREKRKELAAAAGRGPACAGFKHSAGSGASSVGSEEENSNTLTADWRAPAVFPINEQVATRDKKLGRGTGLGVGESGDPGFTILANHPHMVGDDAPSVCL